MLGADCEGKLPLRLALDGEKGTDAFAPEGEATRRAESKEEREEWDGESVGRMRCARRERRSSVKV